MELSGKKLCDHHNHVSTDIIGKASASVGNCKSIKDAYALINKLDKNKFHNVLGWQWPICDMTKIDKNLPVIVSHYSLHDYYLNSAGAGKLVELSLNPIKHEFVKNVLVKKDPIWIEKKLQEIFAMLNGLHTFNVEEINAWFKVLEDVYGFYSAEDMLTPSVDFINKVNESDYAGRCKFWVGLSDYKNWGKDVKNKVEGIKMFLDGGMGVKTASIKNGYQNPLSGYEDGLLIFSDDELVDALRVTENSGLKLAAHCIGDRGIDQFLKCIKKYNIKISQIRIEHVQFITIEQAKECKKMGIKLCMSPSFSYDTTADIPLKNDIMHSDVLTLNNPFRALIDVVGYVPGKDLLFGSDGMPQGFPKGYSEDKSLYPSMRLTEDELIKGYL
jgi:predicted amidohydrolase YtcJ